MMSSRPGRLAIAGLIAILLTCNFLLCGLFSYWGVGIQQIGPQHVRAGSIGGPGVVGGGPGAGK